ncbi:MAG: PAS domain-containing protein [Phycisphaeraceae bacterium]|nr:PAS domain-containing protein [Phycisphaeraceae bacterium]
MKKKRLIWHIWPSYVLLSLLAMSAVMISASRVARTFHYAQTSKQLTSACHLIAQQLAGQPGVLDGPLVDSLCKTLGTKSGYRITVIQPDGTVLGDSEEDPATMDNHGNRQEIQAAMTQAMGRSERYSDTLKQAMMYVAVPLMSDGQVQAIVRTSLSLSQIRASTSRMWQQIVWNGLIIAAISVVAALWISRRISQPLERIKQTAASLNWETMQTKLPSSDISEVDTLTQTLNSMMKQLRKRVNTIIQQRDEQDALLACMSESVLAVDADKNLIKMNRSARQLFQMDSDDALGKNIMEVIRNADLLELVNSTFASNQPELKDIFVPDTHTYLQGHCSVLTRSDGHRMGAVMVLNDITRMRKMERVRREFVADVSHELRTPITSILGFSETLRSGTVDDAQERDHFLDVVCKQSMRLQAIVEDLLSLASIENDAETGEVDLQPGHISAVLRGAVQACQDAADKKELTLEVTCPESLRVRMDSQLLQQAVMNLTNNAIKFSEPDTRIEIEGKASESSIVIEVRDQGPGIARKHHARLFERFYRVDKGRSRRLGGTGLGLAIVKHIALAHEGRVTVESEYGKGSTFSIWLPEHEPPKS